MTVSYSSSCPHSSNPIHLALTSIEIEGLQAPSPRQMQEIVEAALKAAELLCGVAVRPVQQSELLEFFADFVVRCVNRPPGVGDAAAH